MNLRRNLRGGIVRYLPVLFAGVVVGCSLYEPVSEPPDPAEDTGATPKCEVWTAGDAAMEDCDGEDNDCDGTVDEGCECDYRGMATGVCSRGVRAEDGTCSEPADWESTESRCDGLDNDCDGELDEACECSPGMSESCYPGIPETRGVGICTPGTRTCADDGTWNPCEGEQLPETEKCANGDDDNCDGEVDEDCTCDYRNNSSGVCKDSNFNDDGRCAQPPNFEANEMTCNDGLDNDCDGKTDRADSDGCSRPAGDSCSSDADCLSGECDGGTCAHRLFVTSTSTKGNIGGLNDADLLCGMAASNANLGGVWRAILSNSSTSAKARLVIAGPVYNMNGDRVAENQTELWSSNHETDVAFDESGSRLVEDVWSGSNFRGESAAKNCNDWTTSSSTTEATVGWPDHADNAWIHAGGNARVCSQTLHIYCIDGQ